MLCNSKHLGFSSNKDYDSTHHWMRRAQNRERPSGGSGYEEQRRAEMERREEFTFTEQRERKLVAL